MVLFEVVDEILRIVLAVFGISKTPPFPLDVVVPPPIIVNVAGMAAVAYPKLEGPKYEPGGLDNFDTT